MDKIPYLADIDIFSQISRQNLSKATSYKICKNLRRGEQIPDASHCQDKVFVVEAGEIRIYQISEDGREQTLDILKNGAIFGDLSLESSPETVCAMAEAEKEGSCVCIIGKKDFFQTLSKKPKLALKIISELAARLAQSQEKISKLALADAKVRLLSELVRLGRSFGVEDERTIRLKKRFTHEQLAALIGTTRETVTKTIKAINSDCSGCVTLDKNHHLVLDKIKVLEAISP